MLDVACGTGVVGKEVREAGYTLVDGLDPSRAYLEGAMDRGIFRWLGNKSSISFWTSRKVYCNFIDPDKPTPIPDNSYDALLCCAGFFQVHIYWIHIALIFQMLSWKERGFTNLKSKLWPYICCHIFWELELHFYWFLLLFEFCMSYAAALWCGMSEHLNKLPDGS